MLLLVAMRKSQVRKEARLPVKGGQGPKDGQENLLGQVHGVLLVAGLAVGEAVDLVIVGPDELVCRLGRAVLLDGPNPLSFLVHCLTAFLVLYSFSRGQSLQGADLF